MLILASQTLTFVPATPAVHMTVPTAVALRPSFPQVMMDVTSPESIITIFSLSRCKHCVSAKKVFKMRGWKYNEISITDFPERREDARSLVPPGTTSMPQIFFGETRVGGASDLAALITSQTLQAMYDAAAPATDPRLRPVSADNAAARDSSLKASDVESLAAPRDASGHATEYAAWHAQRRLMGLPTSYADYLASKSGVTSAPAYAAAFHGSVVPTAFGSVVPTALASHEGFGGGEASHDRAPTSVSPSRLEEVEEDAHKAETYAEYLARREASRVPCAVH